MNVFTRHKASMSSPPPRHNRERGMALLTAIIFISLALMILAVLSNRFFQQQLLVNQFQIYHTAFDGVEAAMAMSRTELMEDGSTGIIGLDDWTPVYDDDNRIVLPGFDDNNVSPEVLSTSPDVEIIAYVDHWGSNGLDSNGDGTVDSPAEQDLYTIYAAARFDGLVRQAEAVYSAQYVNPWNNAIFGGIGQSGALINGNVRIHGSVHLLGRDLIEGSVAINAMELSGTSMIRNNYEDMGTALRNRIPALPMVDINGTPSESLETTLRVREGLVSLSGNSTVGEAQVAGSGRKGPVDGTYVTDGWTGNSVTNDGLRGIPQGNVHSDNGWNALYDLGDNLEYPYLTHEWRETNGVSVINPNTGEAYSHEDYFTQVLVGNNSFEGDLTIRANSDSSIYWNATTEEYISGSGAMDATPGPNDDYIRYDADNKVVTANGQIRINGDLLFDGGGNQNVINYSGRAAIYVDGELTINTDLLTCNNGDINDTANSFPINNVFGFMSTGTMRLGTGSQRNIMGAFYSEQDVIMSFQTRVVGSLVAEHFNMGNQVPRIFQVPILSDHLPYGMVSNYPIIIVTPVYWREIGID